MEIKLTQAQYDAIKAGLVTSSFELLDINDDGTITDADLTTATDNGIKNEIQALLKESDNDTELQSFKLDDINKLIEEQKTKAGNAADQTATANIKIDGVETVDISNIKDDSTENLKTKLKTIENNIKLIEAKIKSIQDEKKANEEELKKLEADRETKEKALTDANANVEKEQELLDEYVIEYDRIQEEIERTNNRIRIEQGLEEIRYEEHIEKITQKAIDNYDPAEHGENFESYFLKQLTNSGYVMFSGLTSLNNTSLSLSADAKKVLTNIQTQSGVVAKAANVAKDAQEALDAVNAKIKEVEGKITKNTADINAATKLLETNKTQQVEVKKEISSRIPGGGLTAAELLAQIPQTEKNYAKELGWNVKDCVFAMGADGKFHIYNPTAQHNVGSQYFISSVRAHYYKETGNAYGGNSFKEIANGSGFLNAGYKQAPEGSGRAMYTFSCINDDWSDGECEEVAAIYSTCSPLAFDTNGDGVKTSTEKVNFDLDGDGQLDLVNNSADWVLAFDKDKDGIVGENGSELFGNNTDLDGDGVKDGYKDGFEALKALAKKEGLISDGDNALDADDLKKLEDKYGLKMTNGYGGEAKSLADLGITQINLATTDKTTLKRNFDGQNNDLMTQEGATFVVNGETREYADIWNRKYDEEPNINGKVSDEKKLVAKTANLNFNLKHVEAIKGKVDYDKIKADALRNFNAPQEILDKIIKLEEEEES